MAQRKTAKWSRQGASESDAAAHFGVSKTTVAKWKQKGWAALYNDGSINLELTAIQVERSRDPRGTKRLRLTDPPAPRSVPAAQADPAQVVYDDDDLHNARTRKERALAEKSELEVKRLRGELIAVEDARRAYAAVITSARVALEAVPARVAPQVLGLDGLVAVRRIVQAEIAAALRSLPEDAPDVG